MLIKRILILILDKSIWENFADGQELDYDGGKDK